GAGHLFRIAEPGFGTRYLVLPGGEARQLIVCLLDLKGASQHSKKPAIAGFLRYGRFGRDASQLFPFLFYYEESGLNG
ncbi:hypothetical protein, partial [uncultured Alcanivorax sp.]|uniref:hypothetical protein n=1 Tax=uncultured Alcanivorax sp. TaxID=191215 RepID=UPI002627660F